MAQLSFEDSGLGACVQRAVRRGFLGTPHEFSSDISFLTCDESETAVKSLAGIEQLIRLKELKIGYTTLDHLSPLNRLKNYDTLSCVIELQSNYTEMTRSPALRWISLIRSSVPRIAGNITLRIEGSDLPNHPTVKNEDPAPN